MIRTFEVEVILSTTVTVKVDEGRLEEIRQEYPESLKGFDDTDDIAQYAAQYAVRFDSPDFIEGFGYAEYDYKKPPKDSSNISPFVLKLGREDVETESSEITA